MAMNKKVLLLGDTDHAKWHPLSGFDRKLQEILADYVLIPSTDYEQLEEENLLRYGLVIAFLDQWTPLTDGQTAGLLSFVVHGGGLLILHNGIAIQARPELAQLAGGRFIGHPEQKVLEYRPTTSGHVIHSGVQPFCVKEEPYQFILDNLAEPEVLLEYESEGTRWPAGWVRTYGFGRVACLSPGHNLETLHDSRYQNLIRRTFAWLAKLL